MKTRLRVKAWAHQLNWTDVSKMHGLKTWLMAVDYFMYSFPQKEMEFAMVATYVLLLDNKHQWGTVVFYLLFCLLTIEKVFCIVQFHLKDTFDQNTCMFLGLISQVRSLNCIFPSISISLFCWLDKRITVSLCFYFTDNEFDDLEMQVVRYKPEGLDALCKNTKFTRKELQIMYRGFKQVSTHSSSCDEFPMNESEKVSPENG